MALPPRTSEECLAHRYMGAKTRAYSFIELRGCIYGLCYRCVQDLCGVGKPEKDELYVLLNPTSIGFASSKGFKSGKYFNRAVVLHYEVPTTTSKNSV